MPVILLAFMRKAKAEERKDEASDRKSNMACDWQLDFSRVWVGYVNFFLA
jgi:hypothetical protein